jgi:hypothetical protein
VLAFLQKERGLLRPGYKFQPIMRDEALRSFETQKRNPTPREAGAARETSERMIDVSVPAK